MNVMPPLIRPTFVSTSRRACRPMSFTLNRRSRTIPSHLRAISSQRNFGVDLQDDSASRRWLWRGTTIGLCLGTGSLAYWLYTMWRESREIWPEVVATDLRHALYAKHKGDLEVSEQHFRRALQLLLPLPTDALRGDPHLKVTGVAIALADLLESQGKTKEAYDTYADGFEYLRRVQLNSPLSGPETLRLISIAYKLGELAGELKLTEDEEKWLVVAVEQILKDAGRSAGLAGIDLPGWASAVDIAAPLEALADFYEQRGQTEYALPLYLHSASVLVPPKSEKQTSPEDQCRGANMMLKISELILRGPESKHTLHSAEAWAQKGLAVVQEARSKSWGTVPICEEMLVAAYHGAGLLRELSGDGDGARKLYSAAIVQGKSLHMTQEVDMLHECILALRPQNASTLPRVKLVISQTSAFGSIFPFVPTATLSPSINAINPIF